MNSIWNALVPIVLGLALLPIAYHWHSRYWKLGFGGWGQVYSGLGIIVCGGFLEAAAMWDISARFLQDSLVINPQFVARVLEGIGVILVLYGGLLRLRALSTQSDRLSDREAAYELFESLREVAAQPYSLLEIIDYSVKEMVRGQGVDAGGLWLFNGARREWILAASTGLSQRVQSRLERVTGSDNGFSRLLHVGRPRAINESDVLGEWFPALAEARTGSVLALPLSSGTGDSGTRDVLGVLLLCGPRGRFAPRDVRQVAAAADFLTAVIAEAKSGRRLAAARAKTTELERELADTCAFAANLAETSVEQLVSGDFIGRYGHEDFDNPVFCIGTVDSGARTIFIGVGKLPVGVNPATIADEVPGSESERRFTESAGQQLSIQRLHDAWFTLTPTPENARQRLVVARWQSLAVEYSRQQDAECTRNSLLHQLEALREGLRILSEPPSQNESRIAVVRACETLLGDSWCGLIWRKEGSRSDTVGNAADRSEACDLSVLRFELAMLADEDSQDRSANSRQSLITLIGDTGAAELQRRLRSFGRTGEPQQLLWMPFGLERGGGWASFCTADASAPLGEGTIETLRCLLIAYVTADSRLPSREAANAFNNTLQAIAGELELVSRTVAGGEFLDLDAINTRLRELRRRIGRLTPNPADLVPDSPRSTESVDLLVALTAWASDEQRRHTELTLLAPAGVRVAPRLLSAVLDRVESRMQNGSVSPGIARMSLSCVKDRDGVAVALERRGSGVDELIPLWQYPASATLAMDLSWQQDIPIEALSTLGCRAKCLGGLDGALVRFELVFPEKTHSAVSNQENGRLSNHASSSHNDADQEISKTPDQMNHPTVAPGRILIVDDEEFIRELVEGSVESMGFVAITCDNAGSALTMIDTTAIALLITDIHMPDASGIELAREVRKRRPGLPILGITGMEPAGQEVDELFTAVLRKPFRLEELESAIASAMEVPRETEVNAAY